LGDEIVLKANLTFVIKVTFEPYIIIYIIFLRQF